MDAIAERWSEWRAANPHALPALIALARALLQEERAKGRTPRLSTKLLFELARFRGLLDVSSDEGRKWNNDFTALAARAILEEAPDLTLETRARRAEQEQDEREDEQARWTGDFFL